MQSHSIRSTQSKVTRAEIVADLRNIGLKTGDHVAVTVSYGEIGNVEDGPVTVLDSILEVIGPEGTLMMPTYSTSSLPFKLKREFVFDPETSPSYTGYVTELLRLRPGSIRSHHPVSSITSVGKYTKYLTKGHDENALGLLPFFRLANLGGKYLSIGLDDRLLAIRHTGQVLSGLDSIIPMYYATQYRKVNNEVGIYHEYFPCPTNLISITPLLEKKGVLKQGKIGMTEAKIGKAKDIIIETFKSLSKNPELNLCHKSSCIWCRMVEKKLDLYHSIHKPKYYQYPFIREIVSLVNKIRLTRFRNIIYNDSWNYPIFLLSIYLYSRSFFRKIIK